ncbi:MAG: DDE-type integrase/transposase/recombinase [Deltaproteobacteria bacterium]|nr:DDE-type integrase/transposase/recombinase [Deltaproteobacteria bacterium]
MAEVLGITVQAIRQWRRAREDGPPEPVPRGRPGSIPADTRERIRRCYQEHFCQWGPKVLASWVEREGIGPCSATTIGTIIEDLREAPEETPAPVRYEILGSGVMWSEDGTGFRLRGEKKELLVVQDEHSRFKAGRRLADGPAHEADVHDYLEAAFEKHGAPLVIKHDGGAIFHADTIRKLLDKYQVTELTGPPHYPQYNGRTERSNRDIKSYERAMRRHQPWTTLAERLDAALHDLNEVRPRPILGGRTAREVFEQDRVLLPDRATFRADVDRMEVLLKSLAGTREEKESARRRAVERVLSDYGLMEVTGTVSPDFAVTRET